MLNLELKKRIEDSIVDARCFVNEFSGGSDHYSVIVIASAFENKSILARHRMVMDLFKDELHSGEIHALSIKALTQAQWEKEKING